MLDRNDLTPPTAESQRADADQVQDLTQNTPVCLSGHGISGGARRSTHAAGGYSNQPERGLPVAPAFPGLPRVLAPGLPLLPLLLPAAAALFILGIYAAPVLAHDWYDPACCSGEDCARITTSAVSVAPEGWHITLGAGDHPMLQGDFEQVFKWDDRRIRKSQDGDFHICIGRATAYVYCLYVPEFGS